MRQKIKTFAGLACAGALALSCYNLCGQADSTTPAAPAQTPPPNPSSPVPGQPSQAPMRPRPPRPGIYQRALLSLQQTKVELERATDDLGGHRQSAIDACDKAITELQAVMKASGIQPGAPRPMPPPPQRPTPIQQPAPLPQPPPAGPTTPPGQ